jgi:hypothetical protein
VVEFPDEALLRSTIAQAPLNVTARNRLAELLLETGRGGEALEEAQAGLAVMPDHPGLLGLCVMAAELGGLDDLAERYARVLTVVSSEVTRSHPSLASAATTVRWGRRRSDHIGDSELIDLTGSPSNGGFDQILEGLAQTAQDPIETRESRWPLPRRIRPTKPTRGATPHLAVSSPRYSLADVSGMTDLKWRLQGLLGAALGGTMVQTGGLLLFGPVGVGKGFIAEAVAGQIGARLLILNMNEVVEAGDEAGAELIRTAFTLARQASPCLLVLEDVDALSDPHKLHARRIDLLAMRLAMKLDECLGLEGLTVLATTAAPWRVDKALRAAGRLDRGLFMPPPDLLARGRILVDRLSFLPISPDVNPGELAVESEGLTAQELMAVCASAAEHALCATRHSGSMWSVQHRDLWRAMDRTKPSSKEWFVQAHGQLRNATAEVDPVFDYIRRHIRKF